jgi:hypothetical protein
MTIGLQTCENFFLCGAACDVETLSMAYGLCWEPALTQCSIALNYLTGNSADPSAPLPFWDKVFILLGRTHRLNIELDLQSVYGLLCTAVLICRNPCNFPPPPAYGLIYEGAIWSAKIDDISL